MSRRRKKQQPDPLLDLLREMAQFGDKFKALYGAKPGLPAKMVAGPGLNMVDCASIADQIGSLELTGRSFLIIQEALVAFHAHEADDLCEACHDNLHELIKTTANTLDDMLGKAAQK